MQEVLYLSRQDVESLGLEIGVLIDAIENSFKEKAAGSVEMPPKPGLHTRPNAFIHAMPAYLRRMDLVGMKWVSGYPDNSAVGLPYISGLIVLNDASTGMPITIMDATWITAARTAAATAVVVKHLIHRQPTSLCILGCGVQGRSNVVALKHVAPGLRDVFAFDVRNSAAVDFANHCRQTTDLMATVCETPEAAVREADVVVTAGPILRDPKPPLRNQWLKAGAIICTLDFDSYVAPEVFESAGLFVTDDLQQFSYYRHIGYFNSFTREPVDVDQIICARVGTGSDDSRVTIAANLGLAMEDVVVANLVYRLAISHNLGVLLPL